MIDSLAFFDMNPIHIGIVLLLALILFGPQKLPELGKQLGSALRELKKAGSDVMHSFNTDHEPDRNTYDHNYPHEEYNSSYAAIEKPVDMTDYTIVGQPVNESHSNGTEQSAPREYEQDAMSAYDVAPSTSQEKAASSVAAAESQKEEAHHA